MFPFGVILAFLCPIGLGLSTYNHGSNNIFDIIVEKFEEEVFDPIDNTTIKAKPVANQVVGTDSPQPPPHEATARMARYITHHSTWGTMATTSVREPIVGFPFANIFSLSDGPLGESSGVPYMYLTPLDISCKDLGQDPRASLTMSLAQGNFCSKKKYDPEDPRCAHIILTGEVVAVDKESEENKFAERALFSRHPVMPDWPEDHGFYFAKLNLTNIIVLDFFGGAVTVPLEDYFSAEPQ